MFRRTGDDCGGLAHGIRQAIGAWVIYQVTSDWERNFPARLAAASASHGCTLIREGERLNQAKGLPVDWAAFADAWRARYRPSMDRVTQGTEPWTTLDALHR